jgi:hypothetical protein
LGHPPEDLHVLVIVPAGCMTSRVLIFTEN